MARLIGTEFNRKERKFDRRKFKTKGKKPLKLEELNVFLTEEQINENKRNIDKQLKAGAMLDIERSERSERHENS